MKGHLTKTTTIILILTFLLAADDLYAAAERNSPPVIDYVLVTPDTFFANGTVTVQVSVTDPDGPADLENGDGIFYLSGPQTPAIGPFIMDDYSGGFFTYTTPLITTFPYSGQWTVTAHIFDQAGSYDTDEDNFNVILAKRYDMGSSGQVATDYTGVHHLSNYNATAGYGWTTSQTGYTLDWTQIPSLIVHNLDEKVLRDNVGFQGTTEASFRVDVNPGTYKCILYIGEVGYILPPYILTPKENLTVSVETAGSGSNEITIRDPFKARTIFWGGNIKGKVGMDTSFGGYTRVVGTITVPQGSDPTLIFNIKADGTSTSYPVVQSIEVYPEDALPIVYDHGLKELKESSGYVGTATAFLSAMNNHDYYTAKTAAAGISDVLVRACARLWLVGWLDGSEADADLDLLEDAIDDLNLFWNKESVAYVELMTNALDFKSAALHQAARGYSDIAVPHYNLFDMPGNLAAAEQLYRQIYSDMLGTDHPNVDASPLYPRAELLRARLHYCVNTKAGPALATEPPNSVDYWHAIINAFDSHLTDLFLYADDLKIFHFMATHYNTPGWLQSMPVSWNGDTPTNVTPALAWWWNYVNIQPIGAPAWADAQRRFIRSMKNAGQWWMDNRYLNNGELGGGGGDDVEFAGPSYFAEKAIYEEFLAGTPNYSLGIEQVMKNVLEGPEVCGDDFYYCGLGGNQAADVEHAAEYTTLPLWGLIPTDVDNGDYMSLILPALTANMTDSTPWTVEVTVDGTLRRQFHSFRFGANLVVPVMDPTDTYQLEFYDIPLNLRAILPCLYYWKASGLNLTALDELAESWQAHCMSSSQGKPIGIPPAAVWNDNSGQKKFGWMDIRFPTTPRWWVSAPGSGGYVNYNVDPPEKGYADYPGSKQYLANTYSLLLAAYQNSPAPDNWKYLQPILEATRLVYQYRNDIGQTLGPVGGDKWAAQTLYTPILKSYFDARSALIDEKLNPNLNIGPTEIENELDDVLGDFGTQYASYFIDSGTPKDKTDLITSYNWANTWMEYFWILGTSTVAYTDRAYVTAGQSKNLYASMTGSSNPTGNITPIVTWVNQSATPMDVAILVNKATSDRIEILVYNFNIVPQDLTFRIWNVLSPGSYTLRLGADQDNNDVEDNPSNPYYSTTIQYSNPGDEFTIPAAPADGVLKMIVIE